MENQIVHFSRRTVSVVLLVAFIGALIGSGTMYLAIRGPSSCRAVSKPRYSRRTWCIFRPKAFGPWILKQRSRMLSKGRSCRCHGDQSSCTPGIQSILSGQVESAPKASGSGVFISKDGYLITNNHGGGGKSLEVILQDGRRLSAKLIGTDVFADLAVLKISEASCCLGIREFGCA